MYFGKTIGDVGFPKMSNFQTHACLQYVGNQTYKGTDIKHSVFRFQTFTVTGKIYLYFCQSKINLNMATSHNMG